MSFKILVIGAINGRFKEVFPKIVSLHAKNVFAFAIVIGDLFKEPLNTTDEDEAALQELLDGKVHVAVPTHFMLGRHALPKVVIERLDQSESGELCENLFFLGKRTTFKTSEGIRIVALGGTLDAGLSAASSKDKYTPFCNAGDAKVLRGAHSADLLLTTNWPKDIEKGSKAFLEGTSGAQLGANQVVAELCSSLRPRYHFSSSPDTFYEREPFFHPSTTEKDGGTITRFISLAAYGNPSKQKWIYAFSLDVGAGSVPVIPAGATSSPLLSATARKRIAPQDETYSRFSHDDRYQGQGRSNKRQQKQAPPGPSECFFCLSNPNLATHLVTSIGEDAYLTTAKGPLTSKETFDRLPFPGHILIIPLAHAPTLSSISDRETREKTVVEMGRYRAALDRMLQRASNSTVASVTWEVSRHGGVHTHWQYLPIQQDLVSKGLVEAAFKVEAENESYPPFETTRLSYTSIGDSAATDPGTDVFRVTIWSSTSSTDNLTVTTAAASTGEDAVKGELKILTLPLDKGSFRFDLQFGRRVLAKLLGLEDRINWRNCTQSEAEETADAEAFKNAFKEFDFTLS